MIQQYGWATGGHADITSSSPLRIHNPATTGKIVVLNGFPGTGKLTILKKAKALFPENKSCLLDNHLLIDPVEAVIPGRSDEHHELRRQVRAPIFAKLAERARNGCIVFMTACLAENNMRDAAFLEEHLDLVRGADVPIFWVNAHCHPAVLEQRLTSSERCNGSKTKLTDVDVLRDLLRKHRLIVPEGPSDDSSVLLLLVRTLDVSGPVEQSVSHLMDAIGCPSGGVSA